MNKGFGDFKFNYHIYVLYPFWYLPFSYKIWSQY